MSTESQITPKMESLSPEFQVSLATVSQANTTIAATNGPKFGTLIPNRIFVGGITSTTTEEELRGFFSSYGPIKDVKIINDRTGLSKGSYGFVTFENQETAEKIIKNEAETLVFKERKLNIGHAVRKQHFYPRQELSGTVLYNGAIPYTLQNGLTLFQVPGQDYSSQYTAMMLPPPATAMYLPQAQYAYPGATAVIPTAGNGHTPATPGASVTFSQNAAPNVSTAGPASWYALAGLAPGLQTASQMSSNNNSGSITQALRWASTTGSQSPPNNNIPATTYLLSPMGNASGHELVYIPHTGNLTPNSNDYSSENVTSNVIEPVENHNDNPVRPNLPYAAFNGSDRIIPIGQPTPASTHRLYSAQNSLQSNTYNNQNLNNSQNQLSQTALAAQCGQLARMIPACSVLTTSALSRPISRGASGDNLQLCSNHQ